MAITVQYDSRDMLDFLQSLIVKFGETYDIEQQIGIDVEIGKYNRDSVTYGGSSTFADLGHAMRRNGLYVWTANN